MSFPLIQTRCPCNLKITRKIDVVRNLKTRTRQSVAVPKNSLVVLGAETL